MNEQLVVKNFGPFQKEEVKVDFKRVTVFIGPTGGGKSTLAKLAAIINNSEYYTGTSAFVDFNLTSFENTDSNINSFSNEFSKKIENKIVLCAPRTHGKFDADKSLLLQEALRDVKEKIDDFVNETKGNDAAISRKAYEIVVQQLESILDKGAINFFPRIPIYFPSERIFISSIEYSWAGLISQKIGLPKPLLDFANSFSLSRKDISELEIHFLNVKYIHRNGQDFIKVPGREEPLMLLETASGIQSVTPLLVLLEHLSRNTEQAQSFIIEEPELNLYPTAQRDLVYWLLEKCTQGQNDLTITTHSPYVLTALNIALYAHKIATQYPHQKKKVEKILPAKYWLKPEDFSAYYVGGGGVNSIFDAKAGLIDENSLDSVSMELADVFNALTRLRKPKAVRK